MRCSCSFVQAFPGWPKVEDILLLVRFSYTVALTQVLLACSGLQSNVDINLHNLDKDWGAVVRYTCLPFLRRAALLVFILPFQITCGLCFDQRFYGPTFIGSQLI